MAKTDRATTGKTRCAVPSAEDSEAFWKGRVAVLWIVQLLSLTAFCFAIPFAPFHMQSMGDFAPGRLALLTALFFAGGPLGLAVMAPLWGRAADRFGARLMLLRACFLGAVIMLAMGMATTPFWLIALRCIQGLVTGTVPATQSMVVACTPERYHGKALGALSAAEYGGATVGVFVGGVVAGRFGFAVGFRIAALLLVASGILTLFGVPRQSLPATPPPDANSAADTSPAGGRALAPLGLLGMLLLVTLAFQLDLPSVPLLLQELAGGTPQEAAGAMGRLAAVASAASILAGFLVARAAGRLLPGTLLWKLLLAAGFATAVTSVVASPAQMVLARAVVAFFSGAAFPVLQTWMVGRTAPDRRSTMLGWGFSARAIGWVLGPAIGALLAAFCGLRGTFVGAGSALAATAWLTRPRNDLTRE